MALDTYNFYTACHDNSKHEALHIPMSSEPYLHIFMYHWWKADVGTIGYLHPNMATYKTGYKFSSFNIHETLISCLIFTIT